MPSYSPSCWLGLAGLLLSVAACDSQAPPHPDPTVQTQQVQFYSGPLLLEGTLSLPDTDVPTAAVVIVNGSGPVDRDGFYVPDPNQHPPFYRRWAERLTQQNLVVLRYDKRFLTHASVDPLMLSQEDQIDDLLAAFQYLKTRPEVDPERVFLVGHSEGGNLVPVAAQREAGVRGIVVVASVAFAVDTLVVEQLRANPANGTDLIQQVEDAFALLRTNQFPPGGQILGAGETYWREWITFSENAGALVLAADKPTLIAQGLRDEVFPGAVLSKNVALWQNVARLSAQVSFTTYPNLTHMLFRAGTETVSEDVLIDIAEWTHQQ